MHTDFHAHVFLLAYLMFFFLIARPGNFWYLQTITLQRKTRFNWDDSNVPVSRPHELVNFHCQALCFLLKFIIKEDAKDFLDTF